MKKRKSSYTTNIKLKRWKVKYGLEANFISTEGFPFNVFDSDEWLIDGKGSGSIVKVSFINETNLDNETQCEIRLALGMLSSRYAASAILSIIRFLRNLPLEIFNHLDNFPKFSHISSLKSLEAMQFFKNIITINNEKYKNASAWIVENHQVKKFSRNPYDIRKGALSEFEQQSFERELSRNINKNFSNLSAEYSVKKLSHLRKLICIRLMNVLVRRPSNLLQLKWNDIIPVGTSYLHQTNQAPVEFQFSDEEELQVRMWKSKTGATFRKHVETYSLILNSNFTQEVLFYRQHYKKLFQLRLEQLNLNINKNELEVLIMQCPIYYSEQLFQIEFSNKKELFSSLSDHGSGFHEKSSVLIQSMGTVISNFNIKSDRISNIKVGNNRIRHTVGTNAAILGHDSIHISKILGNSADNAKIYIDMSNEQRANINNKFIASGELKQMFDVSIITLKKSTQYTISDDFGNEAGQAENNLSCKECEESRPIGCYGCNNFKALADGNHQEIKNKAQQIYDARKAMGQAEVTLAKLSTQIKWIEITIVMCNLAKDRVKRLNGNQV